MSTIYPMIPPAPGGLTFLYSAQSAGLALMVIGFLVALYKLKTQQDKRSRIPVYVLPFFILPMMLAIYTVHQQATATIEVTEQNLLIHAGLYSQTIPFERMERDKIALVNLQQKPELTETGRINATCGGGALLAGWFRIRNGHKAYLSVTDQSQVVHIPTPDFDILLSAQNGAALVQQLRQSLPHK